MKRFRIVYKATLGTILAVSISCYSQEHIQISGVYPHLTAFNEGDGIPCEGRVGNGKEIGIGAVVPWAGKLWMITYSPHCPEGSSDKLYAIDEQLNVSISPESVGGTPACRMIHRESEQLIIGPYFISKKGKVRVIHPSKMPGRLTAVTRHLKDPANWVYFYDMEGALYEANVHTLEVNKLFNYPIPGWHGKGGYTSQGLLVLANNGERGNNWNVNSPDLQVGGPPKNDEEMGVLATWDGQKWEIIERKQFTDVTGPGDIYGAPDDKSPLWSIGWDKRSVILKLLDNGKWYTFRLPKATHTYDGRSGVYTEWPRIREIGDEKFLMDMHGMFYDFPKTFSAQNTAGIKPIGSHLRYIPDFCNWNGQLILATDEVSMLQNPMAGRSQSNLWFGQTKDLFEWGGATGWGGVWADDEIKEEEYSDPFLINGFQQTILHLTHHASNPIDFTLEIDRNGNGEWEYYRTISVSEKGYAYHIFPESFPATWLRIKINHSAKVSAYLHFRSERQNTINENLMFSALADIDYQGQVTHGLIRPAGHNKNLQFVNLTNTSKPSYYEVDEKLQFDQPSENRLTEVLEVCELKREFEIDEMSVIVKDKSGTFRLPKTNAKYDQPFSQGWPRDRRELESERYMFNVHGTFYEVPRDAGFSAIRPVSTHKKQISDFCTWRGLVVLTGTKTDASFDNHYYGSSEVGLWFGAIDDLWKLGKPVGEGGVWKNTSIKANEPSLPYLMTGYDRKRLRLEADQNVKFRIEVDFDHRGWHTYQEIEVKGGSSIVHDFPKGFSAHWVRITVDTDCTATAWFIYE